MSYTTKFTDTNDYLIATAVGEINTPEAALEYTSGTMEVALRRNYTRMLLRSQALDARLDTHDSIIVVDALRQAAPPNRKVRIASVTIPEQIPYYEVYETVFQNRSFNFRAFTSEEKALEWLLA